MFALFAFLTSIRQKHKLEQIYDAYHKDMYHVAYGVLKDHYESEDVVQTTIIKISELLEKINDIRCHKTRSLIVIITKNVAIDIYRKNKKGFNYPIESFDSIENTDCLSHDAHLIRMDDSQWVAQKLSQINPSYADILTLRYYYEYDVKEIGEILSISENNASVKLMRAKKALQRLIKEDQNDGYKRSC